MKYLRKIFEGVDDRIVRDVFIDADIEDLGIVITFENDISLQLVMYKPAYESEDITTVKTITSEDYRKLHPMIISKLEYLDDAHGIECTNIVYKLFNDDLKNQPAGIWYKDINEYIRHLRGDINDVDKIIKHIHQYSSDKIQSISIFFK